MGIKLYGGARSRASIPQWYLEELGLPYEFVLLDMQAGEHLKPDYLAINPMGKVPALVDGDFKVWESGAILQYLADKYTSDAATPEQRAHLAQWILFANATLGPGIFVESSREKEKAKLFPALNQQFEQHPFVMGDQFTAADVAVGAYLSYITLMLSITYGDYPAIARYVKEIGDRPAFQKTIGARR
jgi:glutathione S-transferase